MAASWRFAALWLDRRSGASYGRAIRLTRLDCSGLSGRLRSRVHEGADRLSMQTGCAPACSRESRARLLCAESAAGEQLLRLCLRKSEHLFGNHEQVLLGAESRHWRRQQTPPQNEHVRLSRKQREQMMEERDYPIGVVDQMQVVNHQYQRLRLSLQIIDKGFHELRDIEFAPDFSPAGPR